MNTDSGARVPAGAPAEKTVGELGELGVLREILAELCDSAFAVVGPGDDAAVLHAEGDTVVTTDTMIEGPDFRLDWHTGSDLGWKLAATNLSDVAAMGATPTALTVALACPPHTPVSLLREIARGLTAACAELAPGCGVVGGDLGQAPVLIAAVTALGDLAGRAPVLRSGARPGDVLAYCGQLGLSALGLRELFTEDAKGDAGLPVAELTQVSPEPTVPGESRHRSAGAVFQSDAFWSRPTVRAQLAPYPPISAGVAAAVAGATAMLDVSDGLSYDAARLARASAVDVVFAAELLTHHFGEQQGVTVPLTALLRSGEDHGLLATFPAGAVLPSGFLPIGAVRAVAGAQPGLWLDGERLEPAGWDPYRSDVEFGSDVPLGIEGDAERDGERDVD